MHHGRHSSCWYVPLVQVGQEAGPGVKGSGKEAMKGSGKEAMKESGNKLNKKRKSSTGSPSSAPHESWCTPHTLLQRTNWLCPHPAYTSEV